MTVLRGSVGDGDPLVRLTLLHPSGRRVAETAVVDTGQHAAVSLPKVLFAEMARGRAEFGATALGDGTIVPHREAVIAVEFCGVDVRVTANDLGEDILIGMALHAGHRLTVECREGGAVMIEPLSQSHPDAAP